jgi:hypothetical protein
VGTNSEGDINAPQTGQLATAKACPNGEEQQCPVPPPEPCCRIGCGDKRSDLVFDEELHGAALVAFGWYGKNALAVKRVLRFLEGHVAEERVQCR